jgi:hypothetical protein
MKIYFGEKPYADCISLVCEKNGRKLEEYRDFCSENDLVFESEDSFYRFCAAGHIELCRGLLYVEHKAGGPTALEFDILSAIPADCPHPTITTNGTYLDDNGAPPGLVKVIKVTCIIFSALGRNHMRTLYDPSSGAYASVTGPMNDFECTVVSDALKGLPVEKFGIIVRAPRSFFGGMTTK